MSRDPRPTRPRLPRTAPNRGFGTVFGASLPPSGPPEERIGDGVALGYRVIEEYIRLGQNAAQAFSAAMPAGWTPSPLAGSGVGAAPPGSTGMNGAAGPMAPPAGWMDWTRFWFDLWQQWARFYGVPTGPANTMDPVQPFGTWYGPWMGPLGAGANPTSTAERARGHGDIPPFEATDRAHDEPQRSSANGAPTPSERRVRIQLATTRPTDCSVDFRPAAGRPILHELRAPDPDLPRIDACRITLEEDEWIVRLEIDDGHPDAIYSGVIVDDATSLPLGTVWVRLGAAHPADPR